MPKMQETINLFVYGSLRNPVFIESITGDMHEGSPAVLHDYKKFFTPFSFPFILPHPNARVHGKCYFDVSQDAMEKIDHFECEGTLYDRKEVTVTVQGKQVSAQAYIANLIHLRRSFGPNMDLALVEKAEKFIEEHAGERIKILMTRTGEARSESDLMALTRHELFGAEIFNLMNMLLLDKYVSDYTIDSHLKIRGLPTMEKIRQDSEKLACARSYMWLAMRYILLNQLEEIFRHQFRTELFIRTPYSRFSLSLLAALILINRHNDALEAELSECDLLPSVAERDYIEFAYQAVQIAQQFFREHHQEAALIVREILLEPQHGLVPMGAELEFSDVGRLAVFDEREKDPVFRHFRYFFDFDLDRRAWKLGGYVDDHKYSPVREKKRGGFLEYSLGKTDILQYDSQPVTDDPRILARLVKELMLFTPVKPHSLHVAFQEIGDKEHRKNNEPDLLLCLLLLAGDFGRDEKGRLVEKRIRYKETADPWGSVHFIKENFHHLLGTEEEKKPLRVMEYQFPRLNTSTDYEPVIVGLKGFHLGYRPRPLSSVATTYYQDASKEEIQALCGWAGAVQPLGDDLIAEFIGYVEKGLYQERKGGRGHSKRYITRILFEVEKTLRLRNEWIRNERQSKGSRSKKKE